ncbi:MAG: D-Ala-D-Ala carboxypeptidase family metallohydrolase [Chthoniobacterales bacterium]
MNTEVLRAIDGLKLPAEHRALLRPGEAESDSHGNLHHLPRFFYEVASWQEAHEIRLAPHFKLAELMTVDCREAELLLREFPHYVPCAIVLLARFLEDFRREVDAPVFVSANGGYRSPAHQIGGAKSIHAWGTAADIYRVGDTFLDDTKSIEKYGAISVSLSPVVLVRPFGSGAGEADDHLHLDLGFLTLTPRQCSETS